MPTFTIEATYRVPVYKHVTIEAETLAKAAKVALETDDWDGSQEDTESSGPTYLTGAWEGDKPYEGRVLLIPDDMAAKDRGKGAFTYLEMEAALCVWECINEWTLGAAEGNSPHQAWKDLRGSVGSVEMRHASIPLGQWCLKVYDICTKDNRDYFDGIAYDWEVIPLILSYCIGAEGAALINDAYFPAPEKIAAEVMAGYARAQWFWSARNEARKQWAYEDLITDHQERCDEAQRSGEEPAAFIKWLGEKYNLTPVSEW